MPLERCPKCNSKDWSEEGRGTYLGRYCDDCNAFMGISSMIDCANFKMPFGKHQGKFLRQIPKADLKWYLENLTLKKGLEQAITLYLGESR